MFPVAGTIPRIALRVVVLPTPFRPSRAVTPPSGTVKSMPCRMCDPAIRTWTSVSRRMSLIRCGRRSALVGSQCVAQVRPFDRLVGCHLGGGAHREQPSMVQHGNPFGQPEDDMHVMLDHADGDAPAVQFFD